MMEIYKQLLETGFKPIYFNNADLEGYVIESRLNYRKLLNLERYEGVVDLIIDYLGRDKYFWLNTVNSIYIELDENLKSAELYYETDNEKEAIEITETLEDILKMLPKEFEYEFLE